MSRQTPGGSGSADRRDAMRAARFPADHPSVKAGRVGVLLVNLGTPEGTDYWSMRRYLSEFLSDRRVIEWSPLLWQPILQGIVLSVRPKKSGALYASIWNKERNESPLRTFTRAQAEKLAAELAGETQIIVDWAMRYGKAVGRGEAQRAAGGGRRARSASSRSIRNTARRRRRPSTTWPSTR